MTTVAKALSLLDLFSEARPAIGLTDFQRLSGRDKATVHRHLTALEALGFLEQNPKTRAYRLGHALERLASLRRRTVPLADTVAPLADHISRQVGELVHLNRVDGMCLRPIYQVNLCQAAVRVEIESNIELPFLKTSSGKAFLAFKDQAFQREALAHHRQTFGPVDEAAVLADLAETRRRGFAASKDGYEVGVSSVGIPLFDADGAPVAACSVAYPTARGGAEHVSRCVAALCAQGAALTERLGGRVPPELVALWAAIEPLPERAAS